MTHVLVRRQWQIVQPQPGLADVRGELRCGLPGKDLGVPVRSRAAEQEQEPSLALCAGLDI